MQPLGQIAKVKPAAPKRKTTVRMSVDSSGIRTVHIRTVGLAEGSTIYRTATIFDTSPAALRAPSLRIRAPR